VSIGDFFSLFGIGYAWLAVIRALYLGSLAGLQVPANRLAERFGDKAVLMMGTATAAIGYGLAGLSGSLFGLGAALSLAGAGSSTQHPIGSGIVSRVYGRSARGPLGIYNFAGDLGKAALPGATSRFPGTRCFGRSPDGSGYRHFNRNFVTERS
jgi:MFS transporter, FSR family, fosmidomycin resistance protein